MLSVGASPMVGERVEGLLLSFVISVMSVLDSRVSGSCLGLLGNGSSRSAIDNPSPLVLSGIGLVLGSPTPLLESSSLGKMTQKKVPIYMSHS